MSYIGIVEADKEDKDLVGVMTAARVDGSCLREKFWELQIECRTVHKEATIYFSDALQMVNSSITPK